ncbi:MAG: PAS domain S-box protein [Methanoregula sp.]|jgi:PAS domain S-box-containing protein|uniref:PAS domain-containing protein n=1 Tax=Methanoregula sp. TaxID=2052170 RepID=UPI003D0C5D47
MRVTTDDQGTCMEAGFLDNALVLIAVLEKNGRVITWNHAAETITGYRQDEVIGGTEIWKHLYPDEEYRRNVTQKIADILATKNYFENFETVIHTRSGEERVIRWNTKEIGEGRLRRAVAVGMDITRQRDADAFRESIIDNAHVLFAVLDPLGNILVWNKAAEKITGYSHDEVIGRRDVWKRLYPEAEYRRTITHQIEKLISAQSYFENLETTILARNGERRIISWNTRQIGSAGHYQEIAIGRDITALRTAEDALTAYMTEMAMRLKQPIEIIGDNLHEVAGLVRDGKLTPEEIIMVLEGQSRNANQIAANVREFQKAIVEKSRKIPVAYRNFLGR